MRNDRITFRVLSVGLTTFVEIEKINRALVFTARQHSSSYAKRCISYDRFCLTVCLTV